MDLFIPAFFIVWYLPFSFIYSYHLYLFWKNSVIFLVLRRMVMMQLPISYGVKDLVSNSQGAHLQCQGISATVTWFLKQYCGEYRAGRNWLSHGEFENPSPRRWHFNWITKSLEGWMGVCHLIMWNGHSRQKEENVYLHQDIIIHRKSERETTDVAGR